MSKKVVIIGNGIAGITAARFIRKNSDFHITVISSETKYFFARTALMYIYMGHMKFEHTKPYEDSFWRKNKINLIQAHVQGIQFSNRKIFLDNDTSLDYNYLIIATGSQPRKLGCEGEGLTGVTSLYSYADLLQMEKLTRGIRKAVVIGGGLIGIEMAEMLRSRDIDVTFLIRENSYWRDVLPHEESLLITNHIRKHGIKIMTGTLANSFIGDDDDNLESMVTSHQKVFDCQFAGVTIGVKPNVDFLRNSELIVKKGICINEYLETSVENVFAIGDCAELTNIPPGRKAIEPVWYTGKLMGETAAKTICGERTKYNPGFWFNSAKFFNVEYQTYGYVPPDPEDSLEWFFWQHPFEEKCIRLVWEKSTRTFAGINALGMRISHPVINDWLKGKKDIGYVVENISRSNFDPEFFTRYESGIQAQFRNEHPHLINSNSLAE